LGRNAANARESVRKANRNRPWPICSDAYWGQGCRSPEIWPEGLLPRASAQWCAPCVGQRAERRVLG
jgi:hypothetical protein